MMKKNILILCISMALATSSFAQTGFNLGVQYGYYLDGMTNSPNTNLIGGSTAGNPLTQFKPKFSSSFGIAAGYGFIPMLGVQAELDFQTMGQESKGTWTGGEAISRDISLNYVQVPVMLKFRTPGAVVHYYILAGPQFNFLSKASINDSRPGYSLNDAKSLYKSADAGIAFGTGLEFDILKVFLNVGLRLYYGMGDPNVTTWQIPASPGDAYKGTHNFYGGLNIGAHFKF